MAMLFEPKWIKYPSDGGMAHVALGGASDESSYGTLCDGSMPAFEVQDPAPYAALVCPWCLAVLSRFVTPRGDTRAEESSARLLAEIGWEPTDPPPHIWRIRQ